MKIALTYPFRKGNFKGCTTPLSLLYLAAGLLKNNYDVKVFDADFGKLNFQDMTLEIKKFTPDIIGVPLFSEMLPSTFEFLTGFHDQNPKTEILVGGPHASARPEKTLKEFPMVNFALRGEADFSIIDLMRTMESDQHYENVKGLTFRQDNKIISNEPAEIIKDLDTLSMPARHLLSDAYKENTYWRVGHRGTTDIMVSSRGCPYSCKFCFKISKYYRACSPENILRELEEIRSMGIRNVHIQDDLFVANKKHCLKTLELIKDAKLGIQFKVRARVNTIDEEILAALKQAGVKAIVYGIESGSQTMLDLMGKKTTVEQNRKTIELTKKARLQCYADMFIGFIGETMDTIKETERFINKVKPTAINMLVMSPFPETSVYKEAKEKGLLTGEYSVKNSSSWIKLPWVENIEQLHEISNEITGRYLKRPRTMLNTLRILLFNMDFRQFKILFRYFISIIFGS